MHKEEILKQIEEIATKSENEEIRLKALEILYNNKTNQEFNESLEKDKKSNSEKLKALTTALTKIGE